MDQQIELFLAMSEVLTGCSRVRLLGTGMTEQYLQTLQASMPAGVLDSLLNLYIQISLGGDQEAALESGILNDPKAGPVARNLIVLWYTGSWPVLPDAWHAAYGTSPSEKVGVVSAQAFQSGLQWAIIGAHAPGSSQQGFASWSVLPGMVTP
jgi:hypothetical protein